MDTCYYCGYQYHPMPVYTLKDAQGDLQDWWTDPGKKHKPLRIHVCHLKVNKNDGDVNIDYNWRGCREKAEADGYEFRPGLTPRR